MNELYSMILDNIINFIVMLIGAIVYFKRRKKDKGQTLEEMVEVRMRNEQMIKDVDKKIDNHIEKDVIEHKHISEQLTDIKNSLEEIKVLFFEHITSHINIKG